MTREHPAGPRKFCFLIPLPVSILPQYKAFCTTSPGKTPGRATQDKESKA